MWKYTIEVTGMMCGMCEAHINETVRKNFPVKKIRSSHKKGQIEIITDQELDETHFAKVLQEIGYDMGCVVKQPYQKKGLFSSF